MPGSHIGLLHNPAALYVVADRLAQPPGTHEPFRPPALAAGVRDHGPWRRPRNEVQLDDPHAGDGRRLPGDGAPGRAAPPRQRVDLRAGPARPADLRRRAGPARGAPAASSRRRSASSSRSRSASADRRGDRPTASTSSSTSATPASRRRATRPRWAGSIARLHAVPLDRSRPLWELWVIDGLRDDRVALYAKIHMAAIDGVTGAEVMTALLDPDPAGKRHVQPQPPIEQPSRRRAGARRSARPAAPGRPLPGSRRQPDPSRHRGAARRAR